MNNIILDYKNCLYSIQTYNIILFMNTIQHNNRQSIIDRITSEYNDELYEIKTQFEKSKKILDDKYNLTIKQINAIYDSYEVTSSQLTVYRSMLNEQSSKMVELLESNLENMPNLENSIFNSQIYKNIDHVNDITVVSVKLLAEIFEERLLLMDCRKLQTRLRGNPEIIKHSYDLKMKVDRVKYAFDITIDNITCYDFKCLVIKERDIIILWKYSKHLGINYITFIKISTGELIYDYGYKSNCNIKFMYCNKQIICIYITDTDDVVIRKFNIGIPLFSLDYRTSQYATIKFNRNYKLSLVQFYSDIRGLYLYYNDYIYFLGKLERGTQFINLDNIINKLQINIKISLGINIAPISDIDYKTGKIYINTLCRYTEDTNDNYNYIVKLGVSDMCKLLY